MKILITASNKVIKLIPQAIAKRLCKNRPYWRDLSRRLETMPLLSRGRFVPKLPENDRLTIDFAHKHGFDLFYGYRILVGDDIDQVDTMLMCVDENGRVVEEEGARLDKRFFYLAVRVPEQDIKSMRYPMQFERMEWVLKNLE